MTSHVSTYAVIFKSHRWDPFIARQLERYRQAAGDAPVFLVLDETGRDFGEIPGPDVLRATNADLLAMGFADRAERGSLLWWNTDYQNYYAHAQRPEFDYYLCVEYDTRIMGDIASFVAAAAAREADMVSLPTRASKDQWMWTRFHARTYAYDDIHGSLNCVALYSRRALALLADRRRAMSREHESGGIAFWPGNEVFAATEIYKAGYRFVSLAEFGDTTAYEWHPPLLEDDVAERDEAAFLHPVLDKPAYIQSLLRFEYTLSHYFRKNSKLRRELSRFPDSDYMQALPGAALARARMRVRERLQSLQCRLQRLMHRLVAS